ncbi:MAG: glycosyltransferase family 39 protein [Phycisphaerae bacterium]|jgi:4-amino-4-deoxy-L-arabinose transferase-like glycosyltransferase
MNEASPSAKRPLDDPRLHRVLVPGLLVLTAVLAVTSLLGDSLTYDENSHLTAGMSVLETGDYRLAPDHPPLAKIWAAWPLLFTDQEWVPADNHGWQIADVFITGRTWLFELNDGERLLPIARCMIVVLLVALCLAVYATARTLFGPSAGLLALALAALSPTFLAHGRLVTTDLPITLCLTLVLLTMARLLQRVTVWRLLAAAAALGAASVTKMSWPLILPAVAGMFVAVLVRQTPLEVRRGRGESAVRLLERPRQRARVLAVLAVVLGLTTWTSIWACYSGRVSMFGPAVTKSLEDGTADAATRDLVDNLSVAWNRALSDENGQPRTSFVPSTLRFLADWNLLPEAYLFGLAWTFEVTGGRIAYFCGEVNTAGFTWYFPVAFAIKTPVATMLLVIAGIVALARRRCAWNRDVLLLTGHAVFVALYVPYVIHSGFNIGQRHLLPIYPALFAVGGAAAAWLRSRVGRVLIGLAVVWLAGANAHIYPHYLSYFNELIGGPANGRYYLADSNIDWGQDLKRLATYAHEHPEETIKLSYFGSADPTCYGFPVTLLPSSIETGSYGALAGGGLYVISVTNLLGVYESYAWESFWADPKWPAYYRKVEDYLAAPPVDDTAATQKERAVATRERDKLRWGRFLYRLRRRPPGQRIGWSMFVYHLSAADVEELAKP